MALTLDDVELRVLGVLIEKALTQPGGYPLTLNALLLGANQKQNRDPVVAYAEADVARAVHSLERKQLVKQAAPAASARVNRFAHNVLDRLHWDRREQAIMAELMLRGRQTGGELRTRASRMIRLEDVPAVLAVLAALGESDPPYVQELPREPGRSANRFRHLLSDTSAHEAPPTDTVPAAGLVTVTDMDAPAPASPSVVQTANDLADRVKRLEGRVDELSRLVDELRKNSQCQVDSSDESFI